MFSAKFNWFLVALILLHDLKVYHLQTVAEGWALVITILCNLNYKLNQLLPIFIFLNIKGSCKKPNGRMESYLVIRDDIEINPAYESHCLIESFEEANKLRCLTACNMDCLCYMLTHGGSTCSLYNHSAVNYFVPKSSNNEKKIYVKK